MFNDNLCDKNLVLIIGENEIESCLFLSLFMGTGVSPVRHGRAHVQNCNFISELQSAPPTRECLARDTGV